MKLKPIGANQTEIVIETGHVPTRILFSYKTPVAAVTGGGFYRTSQKWSKTTSKHINNWFAGNTHVTEKPQSFFDDLVK